MTLLFTLTTETLRMLPIFCPACGSRRYLVHFDGCDAWQIPVEGVEPVHQDGGALHGVAEGAPRPEARREQDAQRTRARRSPW